MSEAEKRIFCSNLLFVFFFLWREKVFWSFLSKFFGLFSLNGEAKIGTMRWSVRNDWRDFFRKNSDEDKKRVRRPGDSFIYLSRNQSWTCTKTRTSRFDLFSNNKDDNKNVRFFLFSIFLRSNQPFRANPGRVFFRKQGLFSLNLVTFIVVLL